MISSRGFTLIELLVAVSIAGAITLLGATLMRTSINNGGRNEELLSQRQSVRDVQRLLEIFWAKRKDSSFRVTENNPEFLSGERSAGALPIRFVCESDVNSAYALWLYGRQLPAVGLHQERQTGNGKNEPVGEMLLGKLSHCRFSYLRPPSSSQTPASWVEEWSDRTTPAVIRLDVATARGALPPFIFSAETPP